MKRQFAMTMIVASCATVLTIGLVAQRMEPTMQVTSTIPTEFTAGTQVLPAGSYTFMVDPGTQKVQVVQESSKQAIVVQGIRTTDNPKGNNDVLFDKVGGSYHLAAVEVGNVALELRPQSGTRTQLTGIAGMGDNMSNDRNNKKTEKK